MWTWILASIALGAVPTTVRPVLAPDDAPAQYEEWARSQGRTAAPLACLGVWEGQLQVCFTVVEGERRRWVDEGDLRGWGVDLGAVVAAVVERAEGPLAERPRVASIEGMAGRYWVSAEGDGWDAALLLQPAWLTARVGAPTVLVAAPVDGTVIAWRPGDAEVDKVMTVGARRMFEDQDGITPVVHRWDGETWEAFGEAVPVAPPPEHDPGQPPERGAP